MDTFTRQWKNITGNEPSLDAEQAQHRQTSLQLMSISPVDEVVDEMKNNPLSAHVQTNGCIELADLLVCLFVEDRTQYSRIVQAILCAMRTHFDDVNVQQAACLAFRRMTTSPRDRNTSNYEKSTVSKSADVEMCKIILERGGIPQILVAVNNFSSSESVQRYGLHVLHSVLSIPAVGALTVNVKHLMVENRCIESAIRAMWAFPHCSDIQEDGCLILWSLSYGSSCSQGAILRHDGVPAILHAMDLYQGNGNVQKFACGALHTLSFEEDVCTCLLDNGGVNLLTAALQNHNNSKDFIEKSLTIIVNIAVANEDSCVLDEMDILMIINILILFMNSRDGGSIRKMGCFLLETAGRAHANKSILEDMEVRDVLAHALTQDLTVMN